MYRRYPLVSKKGKQNFDALVSKCISRDVLTKEQVWRFCKRARRYMLTYKLLELADKKNNGDEKINNITLTKIESMKKVLKSHRAALNFDKNFIINSITAKGFHFEEDVELTMKRQERRRERSGGELAR
jgi:hypothetical protein